jgi:hypothetical protein
MCQPSVVLLVLLALSCAHANLSDPAYRCTSVCAAGTTCQPTGQSEVRRVGITLRSPNQTAVRTSYACVRGQPSGVGLGMNCTICRKLDTPDPGFDFNVDVQPRANYAFSFWMRPYMIKDGFQFLNLSGTYSISGLDKYWSVVLSRNNGLLEVKKYSSSLDDNPGSSGDVYVLSTVKLPLSTNVKWVHVYLGHQKGSGSTQYAPFQLFVDGVHVAQIYEAHQEEFTRSSSVKAIFARNGTVDAVNSSSVVWFKDVMVFTTAPPVYGFADVNGNQIRATVWNVYHKRDVYDSIVSLNGVTADFNPVRPGFAYETVSMPQYSCV